MPNFNSIGGSWIPANEKAVNTRTGEVYVGPDREAVKAIKENGGTMGRKSSEDPENIMRARQLNMSVEEYLQLGAPPIENMRVAEKEKVEKVHDHKPNAKKPAVQPAGGGVTVKGGFGDQPQI